jgi:hypothetical protein
LKVFVSHNIVSVIDQGWSPNVRMAPAWASSSRKEVNLQKDPLYNSMLTETSFTAKSSPLTETTSMRPVLTSTVKAWDLGNESKPVPATVVVSEDHGGEQILTDQLLEIAAQRRNPEVYSEAARLQQDEAVSATARDFERTDALQEAPKLRERRETEKSAELALIESERVQKEQAKTAALIRAKQQRELERQKVEQAHRDTEKAAALTRVKQQRDAELKKKTQREAELKKRQAVVDSKKADEDRIRRQADAREMAEATREAEEKEKRKRVLKAMAM